MVGKQVHDHIVSSKVPPNVYIANTLLKLYTNCGDVAGARQLFDDFANKTLVSYNIMISGYAHQGQTHAAYALFTEMQQQGLEPDKFTYVSVLTACSNLSSGKDIHAQTIKAGLVSDVKVGNALISMYARCGSMQDARQVFDEMVYRDDVSWTALTGGYAESGDGEKAIQIFQQMLHAGLQPSKITYMNVLIACGNLKALEQGKQVHTRIVNSGYQSELRVGTALMKMYLKCGAIGSARGVFDGLQRRDAIAWNTMIAGLVENAHWDEAHQAFSEMLQSGVLPNRTTYLSLLSSCARPGGLARGKELHAQLMKAGALSDARVENALINMYCKAGSMKDARHVFDHMLRRDVISWTTMIGGYAEGYQAVESFNMFKQMLHEGVVPNKVTYLCVLKACGNLVAIGWGKEIHNHIVKAGLISDVQVANALVNMYFKCGSIEDACQLFDNMVTRTTVSWSAMIGGFAQNGRAMDALKIFERMAIEKDVKPDAATFVSVLSACRHAGLVEEGRRQFASMCNDYGIVPTEKHYSCLVDILGRAGRLTEAEEMISTLPLAPTASIWGALLAACRIFTNVEVAERAAEAYLKLDPQNAGVYVSLSDIYAAAGRWEDAAKVRELMKEKGLQKEPGRSAIEVEGNLHSFVANDQSHPRAREIYAELESLTKTMKSMGYVPDTRFVMHEIGDEVKEQAVCHHSEKLAITYGLLSTPPGAPIRISKNLRVCPDCHTATSSSRKLLAGKSLLGTLIASTTSKMECALVEIIGE